MKKSFKVSTLYAIFFYKIYMQNIDTSYQKLLNNFFHLLRMSKVVLAIWVLCTNSPK